jgi:hypothetical protein
LMALRSRGWSPFALRLDVEQHAWIALVILAARGLIFSLSNDSHAVPSCHHRHFGERNAGLTKPCLAIRIILG